MEEGKSVKRSVRDLGDLQVIAEHSARKVRLLTEFLSHNVPDDEIWSQNAKAGFHYILNDLEDDLEFVSEQLCNAGLTIPIMKK
jgi:hypothetical protein